jgi:hypothetical protein
MGESHVVGWGTWICPLQGEMKSHPVWNRRTEQGAKDKRAVVPSSTGAMSQENPHWISKSLASTRSQRSVIPLYKIAMTEFSV